MVSTGDIEVAHSAMQKALEGRRRFLTGARVELELQDSSIDVRLVDRLAVLIAKTGMVLQRIEARPARGPRRRTVEQVATAPTAAAGTTLLHRGPLRGGQRLVHDGSVVVLGDVNPGAEIIASGSVIVWGRVRGKVEAGIEGNDDALVCALDLAPSQLRIGSVITRSPDDPRRTPEPEVARLEQGQIVVSSWR